MPKILVVDDSMLDRRRVAQLLEKAPGIDICFSSDGAEALGLIERNRPDLVLTDLMMPGVDGLELVASVVDRFPLIPVILMTGRGSEEVAVQALRAGASSYVPKSELQTLLLQTVDNVLAVAQGERNHARLMECMVQNQCSFEFGNDDTIISPLIKYMHRCIRSVGLCDETDGVRVCVALEEALRNAMHHGNLELPSELREHDAREYHNLYQQRRLTSPYAERRIKVAIQVTAAEGSFVIQDQGPGFDPDTLPDPTDPANLEKSTGRGLLLMRTFMDDIKFNETGNAVTMIKRSSRDSANCSPSLQPR